MRVLFERVVFISLFVALPLLYWQLTGGWPTRAMPVEAERDVLAYVVFNGVWAAVFVVVCAPLIIEVHSLREQLRKKK